MRIKTIRYIRDALQFLIAFVVIMSILCIIGALSYSIGYSSGKYDGYANGYVNCINDVYVEKPSENINRNFMTEIVSSASYDISYYGNQLLQWIQEPKYNDEYVDGYEYIYVDGEATENQVESACNALNCLPQELVQSFKNNYWTLILANEEIVLNYAGDENYKAAGLIKYGDLTITVNIGLPDIEMHVAHEFGHYLDHISEHPSKSEEFVACYEREWEEFYIMDRSFHSVGTTTEYFAEVFGWYMNEPEKLRENCPMSYDFVEKVIAEYCEIEK